MRRPNSQAHKLVCRSFKDIPATTPGVGVRRIVVFLPNEKKQRLTWAPVNQSIAGVYPENEWYSEDIDVNDVNELAGEEHALAAAYTCKNAWTGEHLDRTIKVVFDENASASYENKNQAVLTATQGMNDMGWRGPVIASCGTLGGGEYGFEFFQPARHGQGGLLAFGQLPHQLPQQNHTARCTLGVEDKMCESFLRG
jgi:hypothetical protein